MKELTIEHPFSSIAEESDNLTPSGLEVSRKPPRAKKQRHHTEIHQTSSMKDSLEHLTSSVKSEKFEKLGL